MNWFPVAERELRVAARKRSTFWLRVGAAAACLLIGGGYMLIAYWQRDSMARIGQILFYMLAWLCLAAALSAGLFLTSDCLSEEKREGTLGLLFLTDLRGYDVVAGKLMVTSLRGFYGLLAALPILAITEIMGGVSSGQYWKSALALINALWASLSVGMLVSSMSRDSQKALGGTFLLVLLLAAGGPLADRLIAVSQNRGFQPVWSLASPGYVLVTAGAWGRSAYWDALLINQAVAWVAFAGACLLAPHTWQERKRLEMSGTSGRWYAWKYGRARPRMRRRLRLLELAPVLWLAARERWQSFTLILGTVMALGCFILAVVEMEQDSWIIWHYFGGLFTFILYLGAASQACRFLVETRRTGFLELLLATPIQARDIVRGQWHALLRQFGLPVLVLLAIQVSVAVLSSRSFQRVAGQVATAAAATPAGTNGTTTATVTINQGGAKVQASVTVSNGPNSSQAATNAPAGSAGVLLTTRRALGITLASAGATALTIAGNVLAICWFGMWMGMTSRTANLATLKTLLYVQVLPWFVITFVGTFVISIAVARVANKGTPAAWFLWWPVVNAVVSACLTLAKDTTFILWAGRKLHYSFREQAARTVAAPHSIKPASLPTPARLNTVGANFG